MPDPREAVYDVLLAKKRRLEDALAKQKRRVGEKRSFYEAWTEYEEGNERARNFNRNRRH